MEARDFFDSFDPPFSVPFKKTLIIGVPNDRQLAHDLTGTCIEDHQPSNPPDNLRDRGRKYRPSSRGIKQVPVPGSELRVDGSSII
jgi:hypothetical protein